MRNYDDMTERVFKRIHEYEDKQSRRTKTFRRFMLAASPLCVAAVIGAGIYLNGLHTPPVPHNDSNIMTENSPTVADTQVSVALSTSDTFADTAASVTSSANAGSPVLQTDENVTADPEVKNAPQENSTSETVTAHDNNSAAAPAVSTASKNVQPTQTVIVTSVQAENKSNAPVAISGGNSSMAIEDRMYTVTVNGALYLQITSFNGRADLLTPDKMIGHGWDYQDDRYWDNTEIYTTKESKYILIARYESGTEIVLRRANDLIVGEDEYFITAWNSGDYVVKEENFIGTVSDYERIYTSYASEFSDPNVILEPECRLYTADENGDILIAVHTNGNAVILHTA